MTRAKDHVGHGAARSCCLEPGQHARQVRGIRRILLIVHHLQLVTGGEVVGCNRYLLGEGVVGIDERRGFRRPGQRQRRLQHHFGVFGGRTEHPKDVVEATREDGLGCAVGFHHRDLVQLGDRLVLQRGGSAVRAEQEVDPISIHQLLHQLDTLGWFAAIIIVLESHRIAGVAGLDAAVGIDRFDPELIAFQGQVPLMGRGAGKRDGRAKEERAHRALARDRVGRRADSRLDPADGPD